jgi:hypothetical protein
VADLLILGGTAGVWFHMGDVARSAPPIHAEGQFETEVAGGDLGMAKLSSLTETRPQSHTPFHFLPNLPKLPECDPLLIGKLEVPRIGLSVMVRGQWMTQLFAVRPATFFRGLCELERGDTVPVSTRAKNSPIRSNLSMRLSRTALA